MTEGQGFAEPEETEVPAPAEEPAETIPAPEEPVPVPPVDADPQDVAEQAAAAEPGPLLPFVPSEGVAGWLRDAITELHNRLRSLGG